MRPFWVGDVETISDVAMGNRRQMSRALAGAVVVALAVPVGELLASWPALRSWSESLDVLVDARGGLWRVMRGVLAYAAIPGVLVAAAMLVLLTVRRSRRDALVLAGAMITANVMVQVLKHPVGWGGSAVRALDPLSGHVGVTGAVLLAWVVTVRPQRRVYAAAIAAFVVSLIGIGVVLASWHSVAQVVCPFLVALGWIIVAEGLLSPPREPTPPRNRRLGVVAVPFGLLVAAVSFALAAHAEVPTDRTLGMAVWCLGGAVAGMAVAGVGVLLWNQAPNRRASTPLDPRTEGVGTPHSMG
jgi:hypothetical protein